jgi:hypothetical protein
MQASQSMFAPEVIAEMVKRAFLLCQRQRERAGLKPGPVRVWRSRKHGVSMVGPPAYRISMYLPAWLHADLMDRWQRSGADCGFVTFIERQLAGKNTGARAAVSRTRRAAG